METDNNHHDKIALTEEQIEHIVSRVIEKMYVEIGKNVVKKMFFIMGAVTLACLAWLGGSGHIK